MLLELPPRRAGDRIVPAGEAGTAAGSGTVRMKLGVPPSRPAVEAAARRADGRWDRPVASAGRPAGARSGRQAPAAGLRLSVVVPTFNRPDLLERCLAALVAQDLSPDAYEIVVADDAASAQTAEQVARWVARAAPAIRYVAVRGAHGPAAARNQGWRAARGDVVAFTDDDCVPLPGWLRAGLA